MGLISNDPRLVKLHEEIERNTLRILDGAIGEELQSTPPSTRRLIGDALKRVRERFADDIRQREL
jgi:hypothetical protein